MLPERGASEHFHCVDSLSGLTRDVICVCGVNVRWGSKVRPSTFGFLSRGDGVVAQGDVRVTVMLVLVRGQKGD